MSSMKFPRHRTASHRLPRRRSQRISVAIVNMTAVSSLRISFRRNPNASAASAAQPPGSVGIVRQFISNMKENQLMVPKIGRIVIATLAIATALGVSACGSGNKDEAKPDKATTSKVAAAQSSYPAVPGATDLNAELQKLMDPNIANEQKLDLIQGIKSDPMLPQRLTDAFKQMNVTITVTKVTDLGNGALTADAQVSINGGAPNQVLVPVVAEDGKWKVQKDWTCTTLSLVQQTSPACS
ncbi:hypothetical protein [Nocardia sp. NPDC059228]|uniref:hypothetical protein n=1 Tax=Nocardia sp. NPDC059228 TaxID=3346777 RepID=UPI0036CD9E1C